MDIQELVERARFLFSKAPKRRRIFELVNGRRSAIEIARENDQSITTIQHDLARMRDLDIIRFKLDRQGDAMKKEGYVIYEKNPILKHVGPGYFKANLPKASKVVKVRKNRKKPDESIFPKIPTNQEILNIFQNDEDQSHEFKVPGVDFRELCKDISGFANTRRGGIIFYGVDDGGNVVGSDVNRKNLEHRIQNGIRSTVSPSLAINIIKKEIYRQAILLILIPGRDKDDVYLYQGRVYIRKGANVFPASDSEMRRLYRGDYVA